MALYQHTSEREHILFDGNQLTQDHHSQPFDVKDRPVQLDAYHMEEGESLCLYRVNHAAECGGDNNAKKFTDCEGESYCLCCSCDNFIITTPGKYILMKEGSTIGNPHVVYKEIARGMG